MKKRFLSILTALTLCLTLLPTAALAAATTPDVWDGSTAAKLTGSGTSEDDPFIISTGAELKLLAENSRILDFGSCYVKLTNDIILNDGTFEKDGSFTKNGEGMSVRTIPMASIFSMSCRCIFATSICF